MTRMKSLTPKELAVLREIDERPGACEQLLAEALEMSQVELTFYLSTLRFERMVHCDEIATARQYRSTMAGRRRLNVGEQLRLVEEPRFTRAQAARGTRRLLHDVMDPRSNF